MHPNQFEESSIVIGQQVIVQEDQLIQGTVQAITGSQASVLLENGHIHSYAIGCLSKPLSNSPLYLSDTVQMAYMIQQQREESQSYQVYDSLISASVHGAAQIHDQATTEFVELIKQKTLVKSQLIYLHGEYTSDRLEAALQKLIQSSTSDSSISIDRQIAHQQFESSRLLLSLFVTSEDQQFGIRLVQYASDWQCSKINGMKFWIENYDYGLLEKKNLITSSFRIFKFFIESLTAQDLADLRLDRYFQPQASQDSQLLLQSIDQLGLDRDVLFKQLAAIIHLQQLQFQLSIEGHCQIINGEVIDDLAALFQIENKDRMFGYFSQRQKKLGNQTIESPMSALESARLRTSIVIELYERLLRYTQDHANCLLSQKSEHSIFVLAKQNFSFPEVCGLGSFVNNYASEKLYIKSVQKWLKQIESFYQEEQVKFNRVDLNESLVDLYEKAVSGLLQVIDEATLTKMDERKLKEKFIGLSKQQSGFTFKQESFFQINHANYGELQYDYTSFKERNLLEKPRNLTELVDLLAIAGWKDASPTDKTVIMKVKRQLFGILKEINDLEVSVVYVLEKGQQTNWQQTNAQLRRIGINILIKQNSINFPIRLKLQQFITQFAALAKAWSVAGFEKMGQKQQATSILNLFSRDQQSYSMGDNFVFLSAAHHSLLTRKLLEASDRKALLFAKAHRALKRQMFSNRVQHFRQMILVRVVIKIQRLYRKWLQRRAKQKFKQSMKLFCVYAARSNCIWEWAQQTSAIQRLQRFFRKTLNRKHVLQLRTRCCFTIQRYYRGLVVRRQNQGILQELQSRRRQRLVLKSAVKIQKHARGLLQRRQYEAQCQGILYLQSCIKMMSQVMQLRISRDSVHIIERDALIYLARLRMKKQEFQKVAGPLDQQMSLTKQFNSPRTYREKFEQTIFDPTAPETQKISFFSIALDIQLFTDIAEVYEKPSWFESYIEIWMANFTKGTPLQQVHVGQAHTAVVNAAGQLFSWGWNDYGQIHEAQRVTSLSVGENHCVFAANQQCVIDLGNPKKSSPRFANEKINEAKSIVLNSIDFVASRGEQIYAVSNNVVYSWQHRGPQIDPCKFAKSVQQVALGKDFSLFLATGAIWAMGRNEQGQLGLGDFEDRGEPAVIQIQEKVNQVACGYNHSVCRANHKVYAWGNGKQGQTSRTETLNRPTQIGAPEPPLSIFAGHSCSMILSGSYRIYLTGTGGEFRYGSFTLHEFESVKFTNRHFMYVPVHLQTSWSRSMSVLNGVFAKVPPTLAQNTPLLKKICSQITKQWGEQSSTIVDPPKSESVSRYCMEIHNKKMWNAKPSMACSALQPQQQEPQMLPTMSSAQEGIDQENIQRLKQIKERMHKLSQTPSNKWTASDEQFIQTMHQKNLAKYVNKYKILL